MDSTNSDLETIARLSSWATEIAAVCKKYEESLVKPDIIPSAALQSKMVLLIALHSRYVTSLVRTDEAITALQGMDDIYADLHDEWGADTDVDDDHCVDADVDDNYDPTWDMGAWTGGNDTIQVSDDEGGDDMIKFPWQHSVAASRDTIITDSLDEEKIGHPEGVLVRVNAKLLRKDPSPNGLVAVVDVARESCDKDGNDLGDIDDIDDEELCAALKESQLYDD
jgi:hypothetical protein